MGDRSFISLLSNRRGLIRWYLWLSWITFFLGCGATAGAALLIWVFRFGAHSCIRSSPGAVTCKDLELAIKITLTIVVALGCWILSCLYQATPFLAGGILTITPVAGMPVVLRHVYSRFAVRDILSEKMDTEEGAALPVDREDTEETPVTSTGSYPDKLANRLAVGVC